MPTLYQVALRILRQPEDAEDALQNGLLEAVRHLNEFEARSQFSTWLTRIVINSALMLLRKRQTRLMVAIDQHLDREDAAPESAIVDLRLNPEDRYVQLEQFQILERKLQQLPSFYYAALWLRSVEGMSTREAADALGVPETSLKCALHRARVKIRKTLQPSVRGLRVMPADASLKPSGHEHRTSKLGQPTT